MEALIKLLDIDETFQKKPTKPKKAYSNFRDNIPDIEDYNFMADTLHLPKTSKGYMYLLVVLDLATREFDIEPMKSTNSSEALSAVKKIFKRTYLNKPYASLSTDGGVEFKNAFHKYLFDNSIYHKVGSKGRHVQSAPVESLNRQLGRLFNGYMNKIELKTGKPYTNWTDIIGTVRTELNKIRKRTATAKTMKDVTYKVPDFDTEPKFKVGDFVHVLLDHVENAQGEKQSSEKFREGDFRWDRQARKIKQVFAYAGNVPYRYHVEGIPKVAYAEWQLLPSEETEELYEIRQLLKSRTRNGKKEILTWYYGERKADASWQPRSELIKFVPDLVKKFEDEKKKK